MTDATTEFEVACDHDLPLRAFLSLSQHSAGRSGEALASALRLVLANGSMDGYEHALAYYCDELTS